MKEPKIIINGNICSEEQAKTIRIALDSFAIDLRPNDFSENNANLLIKIEYFKSLNKIQEYIKKQL